MTLTHRDPDHPIFDNDETSPLLPSHSARERDHDQERERSQSPTPSVAPNHPHFLRVALLCVVCIFLIEIGDYMQRAPFMRILEDIVCRQYYERVSFIGGGGGGGVDLALPIPEENCKLPVVQSELAMLKGWDMTFSCIPSMLLAVPYGVVADRYGRRLVLILAILGAVVATIWMAGVAYMSHLIDIRWYWAGNIFLCIGGGPAVIKSMFFALLADVASEDKRASVFFQLMAAALISTVIGVPSAWYLMRKSMWLPIWFAFGFYLLGFLSAFFLPETLDRSKILDPSVVSDSEDEGTGDDRPTSSHQHSRKKRLSRMIKNLRETHFILKSPMLAALSITFLLQSLSGRTSEFLYQLASERFHMSLGDASFLIPVGAVTNFVILVVALPAIYWFLSHKLHLRSMTKDLIVARGSITFLVVGCLSIAFAPLPGLYVLGTMIMACGAGFSSATRSLVTSLVHPDEVSRLYGVLAVGETIGTMIYGPILAKAFGWGLDLGTPWTGMCFLVVAAMYVVVGLPLWLVAEPTPEMDVHG